LTQNTLKVSIYEGEFSYKVETQDHDLKIWNNVIGDEMVEIEIESLPGILSDNQKDKVKTGHIVDTELKFSQIPYEIRDRKTGKTLSHPSQKQLIKIMTGDIRGEGGQLIEPDHPDSPLRKMGLI